MSKMGNYVRPAENVQSDIDAESPRRATGNAHYSHLPTCLSVDTVCGKSCPVVCSLWYRRVSKQHNTCGSRQWRWGHMSKSTSLENPDLLWSQPFDSYLITIPAEYRIYKTQFRLGRITYGCLFC